MMEIEKISRILVLVEMMGEHGLKREAKVDDLLDHAEQALESEEQVNFALSWRGHFQCQC